MCVHYNAILPTCQCQANDHRSVDTNVHDLTLTDWMTQRTVETAYYVKNKKAKLYSCISENHNVIPPTT